MTLTPEQIAKNFEDIAPALTKAEAFAESARCLFCYDAPCTNACPTHIDVPAFIKKIHNDNTKGAARVILDANPMGHSCARACPVEALCEGSCVMNHQHMEPIQIARLQRFATDAALEKKWKLFTPGKPTGKKVAIVGAGPAGLSCAQDLRRAGHDVVVYDAKQKPGGLNTYGIAQYKLKPDTALAEAEMITALGVKIENNVVVGKDVSWADLDAKFDAVFLGVGLGSTQGLGVTGEDLDGVVDALTFIEHLKTKPYGSFHVPNRVLVVGAGNTAVDAATQAKRLGAESVQFVYRRSEADAPAYDYEIELAKKDGCGFIWRTAPVKIVGENGRVVGLECVKVDEKLKVIEGSDHVIACDLIIKALGQTKRVEMLRAIPRLQLDDKGRVVVNANGQTTNPKFFAGGDCINGGKEIVNAAADGKKAAAAIGAYFAS
jgi:glutamate synthase (NADPH/NADH) small chain